MITLKVKALLPSCERKGSFHWHTVMPPLWNEKKHGNSSTPVKCIIKQPNIGTCLDHFLWIVHSDPRIFYLSVPLDRSPLALLGNYYAADRAWLLWRNVPRAANRAPGADSFNVDLCCWKAAFCLPRAESGSHRLPQKKSPHTLNLGYVLRWDPDWKM